MSIYNLNLATVRNALAKGEMKAEDAVQACLEQTKSTEQLQSYINLDADKALELAHEMDKSGPDGNKPLWGVPISIKDAICTKGLTTTAGSKILSNYVPFYDAHVVQKLREAGAIILGKTNLDEFSMGSSTENSAFFATHNPWDIKRVPGGSSGGSACAVVAKQCFAALGSDTGGSIRQPASLCGCVGVKPTYGRVSRYGLIAYGSSLDQIGPLARSVEDCALVLENMAGYDERDSTSAPIPLAPRAYSNALSSRADFKGLRVGVPKEFFAKGLASEVEQSCQAALATMQHLGAELVDIELPHTNAAIATYYIVAMAEASSNLARFDGVRYGYRAENIKNLEELYVQTRSQGFGQEVQRRIMLGTYVLSSGYYDAYFRKAAQVRRLIKQDFDHALQKCDIICGPISPTTAWELGSLNKDPLQMYLMDVYTLSLNLAGLPGIALPVGMGQDSKLPVGMQIIGKAFSEEFIFSVAHTLEQSLDATLWPEF